MPHFLFFLLLPLCLSFFFFFFNDTATTEIYTLSLHDALPISLDLLQVQVNGRMVDVNTTEVSEQSGARDRKSTRLNSSHLVISYAVFCLKKKKRRQPMTYEVRRNRHELCSLILA